VFKADALSIEPAHLGRHLLELRVNAKTAFFGSLTEEAVNLYA
jgi:hypothetical protein